MPSQPLVSVIIVTYNSAEYLESCLRSVLASAYWPIELVLIDNSSTDNSVKIARKVVKDYPKVTHTIKHSGSNLGYAAGNNLGAKSAKGKYLFFMNPDTVVDAHFLIDLVAAAQDTFQLAVLQPAVYLMKNTQLLNLTGKESHYLGIDWVKNYRQTVLPDAEQLLSFSGSGFLIRAEVFRDLGGFDETYFMYYEDTDLAWKLFRAGFDVKFIPTSTIYHDYHFEPEPATQSLHQKLMYAERNRLLTILKHYSLRTLLILSPALIVLELALLVYSLLHGWGKQKIQSYYQLIHLHKHITDERKKLHQPGLKTDGELLAKMQPTITSSNYAHPVITLLLNPFFKLYYQLARTLV